MIRFTVEQAQAAADEWGFNCGPAALCAITGKTPAEIRPFMGDFEKKRYTNPTLMKQCLARLGVAWKPVSLESWPRRGLVRIQWGGPWMREGVPIRARYRHTHWVACKIGKDGIFTRLFIFDVNAACVGGWIPGDEWMERMVPWLLKHCEPKNDGTWTRAQCWEIVESNA